MLRDSLRLRRVSASGAAERLWRVSLTPSACFLIPRHDGCARSDLARVEQIYILGVMALAALAARRFGALQQSVAPTAPATAPPSTPALAPV